MTLSWLSIFRLGAVQMCLGAVVVLMTSTLNRLMVVELALPAILPGFLVALHYGIQITRPQWGYRSDTAGNRTRWIVGGMAVLSAEYRWPLWVLTHPDATGMDIYLHTDVGQVFGDINQVNRDNLTFSYGVGVRLLGAEGFVLRIEYAHSNEANVWRLRGDQIFQFTRGGFFHGRDPIPAR